MLVSVIVFAFCFQVPMWPLMGAQLFGHTPLQPFRVYPQQAYVPPGSGLWTMSGVHQVATPFTDLSRGSQSISCPSTIQSIWWLGRVTPIPSPSLHVKEWSSVPRFLLLIEMVNINLCWGLILVIPTWWLALRLMNFLLSGWQNIFYLFTYLPWVNWQSVNT